jgi:hypothetical protein
MRKTIMLCVRACVADRSMCALVGNFIPSQERIALWDLETDYYLHIKSAPNTDRLMRYAWSVCVCVCVCVCVYVRTRLVRTFMAIVHLTHLPT